LAEPALKKVLRDNRASAELRRRAGDLLTGMATWALPAGRRRELRGVEILEGIATPEARKVLTKLAEGPAEAWLTQEAKRTLDRLDRRDKPPVRIEIKADTELDKGNGDFTQYGSWSLVFSADGKVLFAGSPSEPLRAWDFATGRELRRYGGQESRIIRGFYCLALSPDGTTLAAGSHQDFRVHLWDAATGKELKPLGREGDYYPVAFSPDGQYVAAGSYAGGDVTLYRLDTRNEVWRFRGDDNRYPCLAFSPDGRTVATATAKGGVVLWETATGLERARFAKVGGSDIRSLAFVPGGRFVAAAEERGTLHVIDRFTGAERTAIPDGGFVFAISPDGKRIATSVMHRNVHLFDAATGKEEHTLPARAEALAFSTDGKTLLTTGIGGWVGASRVRMWDVATGKEKVHNRAP
jgi:WD40 repeat protein